jgi:hypothetical protein
MTQANDSITVTPGTGATVATHLANSREHQVVMQANAEGHILGSLPTYSAWSGVIAAAANKVYMHIFNASGSGVIVKMRKLFIQPNMAVNALAAQDWRLSKTTAVGTTGNTAITIRAHDSSTPAVPAQVTAAHSFTAGGTTDFDYFGIFLSTEETFPGVHLQPYFNILPVDGDFVQDYVLGEGQGIKLVNVTGGVYSYSALAVLTIE